MIINYKERVGKNVSAFEMLRSYSVGMLLMLVQRYTTWTFPNIFEYTTDWTCWLTTDSIDWKYYTSELKVLVFWLKDWFY